MLSLSMTSYAVIKHISELDGRGLFLAIPASINSGSNLMFNKPNKSKLLGAEKGMGWVKHFDPLLTLEFVDHINKNGKGNHVK